MKIQQKNNTYLYLIFELWRRLSYSTHFKIIGLIIIMIFASFAEVLGIGSLIPFLGMLISPEIIMNWSFISYAAEMLGLQNKSSFILFAATFFCFAIIIATAIRLVLLRVTTSLAFTIGSELNSRIYRGILYQPYLAHKNKNSSELIGAISIKTNSIIYSVILPLLTLLSSFFIFGLLIVVLVTINPFITIFAIIFFGFLYLIVMVLVKNKLKENGLIVTGGTNSIIKLLQESFGGIRDILIDGSQNFYFKSFSQADLSLRKAQGEIQFISASPKFLIEGFGIVLIAISAYWFTKSEDSNSSALVMPILGAAALGAQRMLPILQQGFLCWASLKSEKHTVIEILDLLDLPVPDKHNLKISKLSFKQEIELQDICFRYRDDQPYIIEKINFAINKGARIGIIGETGCGKSTLLDIVMGLLQPNSGSLIVDGVLINELNMESWQANIAHVPQSIFITDGSILDNITLGCDKSLIDQEHLQKVCKQSRLQDVIDNLTGGINAKVGENGALLSGGQRQRIGIARALYKKANLIIFDEATSALDVRTEEGIMEAINYIDRNITILMVAHRISTLRNCDLIILLEGGAINRLGVYKDFI